MAYITYTEYKDLGGTATETAFNTLILTVESKLNYITNGRIKKLNPIPIEVKQLCVKLVNTCDVNDAERDSSLSSYSNGIESFSYSVSNTSADKSTSIDGKLNAIIKEWLWDYPDLLYRGRKQWKQR